MKLNLFSKLVFAAALAFLASIFIYFSYANVYSSVLFNEETFHQQYGNGIYQYRILSSYTLESVDALIKSIPFGIKITPYLWDKGADPGFYISFAVLNTFFTVLSAIMMVFITESKYFIATETEKTLLISASLFAIIITQFVVVPYDCSSYFFLLLFFWVFLKFLHKESWSILAVLMLIMVISSLNRETSALSISLAATILFAKSGTGKKFLIPVFFLVLSFVVVYFGVRLYFGRFATHDNNLLALNFRLFRNWLGIFFWLVFFAFSLIIAKDRTAVRNIVIFHFFAIPYIFMSFYGGILYETRLYVPLFLTSVFLGRTELNRN